MENEPSIRLFQGLGFHVVKTVEVFAEVELRLNMNLNLDLNEVDLAPKLNEDVGKGVRELRDGDGLPVKQAVQGPHTRWIRGALLNYP